MLKPSIDELLNEIHSRFALTIVIAKRARQLQLNPDDYKIEEPVGNDNNEVAKALEELNGRKLEYYLTPEDATKAQESAFANIAENIEELFDGEVDLVEELAE